MAPKLADYANPRTYDHLPWDSRNHLNRPIHAVALNRSGKQSTRIAAPENRSQRESFAADTRDSTRASYDHLPQRVTS